MFLLALFAYKWYLAKPKIDYEQLYLDCLANNRNQLCEALTEQNLAICDELDGDNALWCKAIVSRDIAFCDRISDDFEWKVDCYIDLDPNFDCDTIENDEMEKAECLAKQTGDPSYCMIEPKDDFERDEMEECIADVSQSIEDCDKISNFVLRLDCQAQFFDSIEQCQAKVEEFCRQEIEDLKASQ